MSTTTSSADRVPSRDRPNPVQTRARSTTVHVSKKAIHGLTPGNILLGVGFILAAGTAAYLFSSHNTVQQDTVNVNVVPVASVTEPTPAAKVPAPPANATVLDLRTPLQTTIQDALSASHRPSAPTSALLKADILEHNGQTLLDLPGIHDPIIVQLIPDQRYNAGTVSRDVQQCLEAIQKASGDQRILQDFTVPLQQSSQTASTTFLNACKKAAATHVMAGEAYGKEIKTQVYQHLVQYARTSADVCQANTLIRVRPVRPRLQLGSLLRALAGELHVAPPVADAVLSGLDIPDLIDAHAYKSTVMSGVTALLGVLVDDDSISADTYICEVINTVSAIEMYSKTSFWNPADMPVLQTMYSAHTDADGIIQRLFDVQDVDARDAVLKPLLTAPPAQDIKDPLGDMASAAMDLTWTMTRVSKAAETCVDHLAGLDVTGRWPGLRQVLENILGVLATLGVVLSTVWKLSKATDEPVPADLTDKAHRGLRQPDPPRETVQGVLDTIRELAQVVRSVADVLPQRVLGAAKDLPSEKYPGLTDYLVKETNRAVAQMNQASLALAGAGPQRGGGSMDLVKSWRESSAYRRIRLIRDDRPSHDVLDAFYESYGLHHGTPSGLLTLIEDDTESLVDLIRTIRSSPPYRPWVGYRNWARDLVKVPLKRALAPGNNGRSTRYLVTLQFDGLGSSVDNGSCLKMTGRYYRNVLIVECQRDSNGYLPTEVTHYQHVVNQILHPATGDLEHQVRKVFGGVHR